MASSSFKKRKGESTRKPNWLELPIDLTKNILQRLDTLDIMLSARNVCPLWWHIFKDPLMWCTIRICNIEYIPYDFCCLDKIVRRAVDLSRGHLEDIAIELFCTDDLLKYIAHRASNLRCLVIPYSNNISNKGLIESVKMFSLLEELHISFKYLSKDCIEVIGQFCPLLKSLNFDGPLYTYFDFYDDVFAIGETMPGLRHLSFSRIVFDNHQLFAILNGCPLIESLDLQHCLVRHLSPSVEKRCREQIKDFQLPIYNDYEDDYDEDVFAYMPFEEYDDEYWEQDYRFAIATWSHKGDRYPALCCVTGCTCSNLNSSKYYPKL